MDLLTIIFLGIAIICLWILIAIAKHKKTILTLERLIYEADRTNTADAQQQLEQFAEANGISDKKMHKIADAMYTTLAEQDNLFALTMAYVYHHDDKALALKYLSRAAQLGDAESMFRLGMKYDSVSNSEEFDDGFGHNPAVAFSWYSKAAQLGYEDAIERVASAYYFGNGIKEDKEKAYNYAKNFSDRGYPKLSLFLVDYYYDNPVASRYHCPTAIALLERVLFRGDRKTFETAASKLGRIYGRAYLHNASPDQWSDRRKAAYCFFLAAFLDHFDEHYVSLFKQTGYMATQFEIDTWKNDAQNLRYNPH